MNKFSSKALVLLSFLLMIGCTGGERPDTVTNVTIPVIDETIEPNHFLSYVNRQPALAAGTYEVSVATASVGESGSYQLEITLDSGAVQTTSGEWNNSGGMDPQSASNPRHSFTLQKAGGITLQVQSSVDSYLYLLRNDHVMASDDDGAGGGNARISMDASSINSAAYAEAYYKAVDPNNERTTLADWKSLNGFDQSADVNATFRDIIDLGYGRDMYARTRADGGIAVYVDNYLFQNQPGDASLYSPLSLDAAIARDERFLIGTNVIEYSPVDPNDAGSEKIAKLIAYGPRDANGTQSRVLKVNFDGRGEKFMPGVCGVCHGASLYPLEADGAFPKQALRSLKMNILDPKPFGFSTQDGFTEGQQESRLHAINQMVHGTFTGFGGEDSNNSGKWSPDFALDLDAGAYGGDFSRANYDHDYIPEGWRQNENRPAGVESLYLDVIKVHCIACHALRGTELAESITTPVGEDRVSLANAINFSSYEKFISYNDQIIDLVYRRGQMPLSFLNYRQFWSNPAGVPTQLAAFLQGFDVYDDSGKITAPQMPLAIAGGNRVSSSPVLMNGSASFFAASHEWRVTGMPAGAVVSVSSANAPVATITADLAGDYVVELSVTNGLNNGATDRAVITLDPLLNPESTDITFDEHIVPILSGCAACHVDGGFFAGIPVDFSVGNQKLYSDVLARTNLDDPQSSLLLTKPTGSNHAGGLSINRANPTGEANYQLILNWLINGAPCGTDVTICR